MIKLGKSCLKRLVQFADVKNDVGKSIPRRMIIRSKTETPCKGPAMFRIR
jgi:hypothetical protein